VLGGWLSSFLIHRHVSLNVARKVALGLGASMLPVSLLIVSSQLQFAIVFFSVAMFAHQFWSANMQTLPTDIFPSKVVGSVGGLLGSAGSFGGMLFGLLVGYLVEHEGYAPAFFIAGLLHPVSFLILLAGLRRIRPIDSPA
jgi:ACS family hexuronate transporter-like MFS transporter